MSFEIEHVHGRQVLDSRGNPTVEVEVHLGGQPLYPYYLGIE